MQVPVSASVQGLPILANRFSNYWAGAVSAGRAGRTYVSVGSSQSGVGSAEIFLAGRTAERTGGLFALAGGGAAGTTSGAFHLQTTNGGVSAPAVLLFLVVVAATMAMLAH